MLRRYRGLWRICRFPPCHKCLVILIPQTDTVTSDVIDFPLHFTGHPLYISVVFEIVEARTSM